MRGMTDVNMLYIEGSEMKEKDKDTQIQEQKNRKWEKGGEFVRGSLRGKEEGKRNNDRQKYD